MGAPGAKGEELTDTVKNLADDIAGRLLEAGFTIQRYDAYSTASVYLKLDYGVCNSIRISDHKGKRYLKYRYNIGPHIRTYRKERDVYDRYYYSARKADSLVKKVCADRQAKLRQYGPEGYQRLMRQNRCANSGRKGFWREAVLLRRDQYGKDGSTGNFSVPPEPAYEGGVEDHGHDGVLCVASDI